MILDDESRQFASLLWEDTCDRLDREVGRL